MSIDDVEAMLESPDVEIDPDNWQTVQAFLACSTQWVYAGMGGIVGLNYPGVKAVLDLTIKPKHRAEIFAGIQLMERAALTILNEKSSG